MTFMTKAAKMADAPQQQTIAILAFPGVQALDVVGPIDVFTEVNHQIGQTAYHCRVIGLSAEPIATTSGMKIVPDSHIESDAGQADIFLVAGSPDIRAIASNEHVRAWLRRVFVQAGRRGSVCSGAYLLAASGLLDGKVATTHWNIAGALASEFPDVQVDADRIFLKDGNIYTSAGVTASMDLALAMVEEDHGKDIALAVARELVMFIKRPGGQTQFSPQLAAQISDKSVIQRVQADILAQPGHDHSVAALAKRAGMSSRNFARVFRKETGMTPAEFVEGVRLESARRLLEDSTAPLQRVATNSGFVTLANMRRAFQRRLNINPAEYRERFRSG